MGTDILLETVKHNVKASNINLLRTMINDTDKYLDNLNDKDLWIVKNFIESYINELNEDE